MTTKKTKKTKTFAKYLLCILLGASIGFGYQEIQDPVASVWNSFSPPSSDSMGVCFTPPGGCGNLIAREVASARESIHLQAYGLTSHVIVGELLAASKRGVRVRAILDRSNFSERKFVVRDLRNAGVEVTRDKVSGIAHNKVMIIDERKVITGSFNFTEAADKRNAENVLLIQDKRIASEYLANWMRRWEVSK